LERGTADLSSAPSDQSWRRQTKKKKKKKKKKKEKKGGKKKEANLTVAMLQKSKVSCFASNCKSV
jgi:hypothetical protein